MTLKYTAEGTATQVMTTELNALATSDQIISSSSYSNDAAGTERQIYAEYSLYVAVQGGARTGGNLIELAMLPAADGTNFPDWDEENLFDNYTVKAWKVDAAVTARTFVVTDIKLPPSDYKLAIRNESGQALAAADSILTERRYSYEDVT